MGKIENTEIKNTDIPVYVRRSLDLSLDTNGYPHTEGNRQVIWAEIKKLMSKENLTIVNDLALRDHNFEDNAFSDAESEAFDYCEEHDLFRTFKEDEETGDYEEDNLPGDCYDNAFFIDVNSPWPESKIKD